MNGIRIKFGLGLMALFLALLTGCAAPSGGTQGELTTSSDQTDIQKRVSLRMQLAIGYFEQRQWNVALDEVKQVLAIDPNNADAYSIRALIYMEMKENRLAEANFLQAMKLLPNNPDYSNNYGWFLCQNGREKESIPYFEAALGNPAYRSPVKAFNNAGLCSLKLKQDQEAMQYFSRAFQLDPSHPMTNAYLSRMYMDSGDETRARFYLNRLSKADFMSADVLMMAIKVARKLGDRSSELSMVSQLRRDHDNSPEYGSFQREALND